MSSARKTYDGDLSRRYTSIAERRNPINSQSKVNKSSAAKRAAKVNESLSVEDYQFNEGGDKDRYLITYADLITLLLGLFIILYAISNIDSHKYQKVVTAAGDIFGSKSKLIETHINIVKTAVPLKEDLNTQLTNLINKYHYNNSISLEQNSRGITIHILDDILFGSGSANLAKNSLVVLNHLAELLKELPNDIRIEGHTDNVPINTTAFPSNWHLSVARALNTAYYLIKNEGLNADKVSIVGYSEYKPIASNLTAEGRATNRRVDIIIIKK